MFVPAYGGMEMFYMADILRTVKCTAFSAVLLMVLLLALALLSYCSSISNSALTICVYSATIISVFAGALAAVKSSGNKPLLRSAAVGVLFYAILVLLTILINGRITADSHFYTMSIGIFAAGLLSAFFR